MADEVPIGEKAIFAFLEMFALAFAFEGTSALLHGEPFWRVGIGWLGAVLFFWAGIKWSWLKTKLNPSFVSKTESRDPRLWLAAGANCGSSTVADWNSTYRPHIPKATSNVP